MFQKSAETSSWNGFCKPDFEKKIVVCKTLLVRINNRIRSEYTSCAAPAETHFTQHCLLSNITGINASSSLLCCYCASIHHRVRPHLPRPVVNCCGHHHFLVNGTFARQERNDLVRSLWWIRSANIQMICRWTRSCVIHQNLNSVGFGWRFLVALLRWCAGAAGHRERSSQ